MIFKRFEKRIQKVTDDQEKIYKIKVAMTKDLKQYYEKNITTKQTRDKIGMPSYLFIFK